MFHQLGQYPIPSSGEANNCAHRNPVPPNQLYYSTRIPTISFWEWKGHDTKCSYEIGRCSNCEMCTPEKYPNGAKRTTGGFGWGFEDDNTYFSDRQLDEWKAGMSEKWATNN